MSKELITALLGRAVAAAEELEERNDDLSSQRSERFYDRGYIRGLCVAIADALSELYGSDLHTDDLASGVWLRVCRQAREHPDTRDWDKMHAELMALS